MNMKRIWYQMKKQVTGLCVGGGIGKIYSIISFNGYMKSKTKHMIALGMQVEMPQRFIASDAYFDGHDYSLIKIYKDVTISREVMFLTHDYSLGRAMSACGISIREGAVETPHFAETISIGESSFIGARASILPGTSIGRGCIIGACAVVKGEIPDYSIVIGNPGKIVGDVREWVEKKTGTKSEINRR